MTLQLSQVQTTLYGATSFTAVPYYLGCSPLSAPDLLGDDDCQASREALNGDAPLVLGSAGTSVTFEGSGDWPIEVSILGQDALLPDNVPTWTTNQVWTTLCREGDIDDVCLLDGDADTWCDSCDCDPTQALIHPVNPGEGTGVDGDCDGWTWPL